MLYADHPKFKGMLINPAIKDPVSVRAEPVEACEMAPFDKLRANGDFSCRVNNEPAEICEDVDSATIAMLPAA